MFSSDWALCSISLSYIFFLNLFLILSPYIFTLSCKYVHWSTKCLKDLCTWVKLGVKSYLQCNRDDGQTEKGAHAWYWRDAQIHMYLESDIHVCAFTSGLLFLPSRGVQSDMAVCVCVLHVVYQVLSKDLLRLGQPVWLVVSTFCLYISLGYLLSFATGWNCNRGNNNSFLHQRF